MRNKEQAILEAAEREFIAKGFAGARTTSIAEAAGVTHAMLHYYFRTKEQLFERILDEKMRLMGESVLAAFGDPALPFLAISSGSSTPRPTAAKRKGSTCGCCCSTSSRSTSFRSSPILSSNRFWGTSRPTANGFSHGAGRKTRR